MEDLVEYLEKVSRDLKVLSVDIARMAEARKEADQNGSEDVSVNVNTKSLRRLTNLRENVREAKEAQENPEVAFIIDQINKIFEG